MTLRCLNLFSRSRSGKQAATAAAPNTNRFKPVQRVAAGVAVQRVSVCVCICVAYLMRFCFTCMCVCVPLRTVASRREPLSLSLTDSALCRIATHMVSASGRQIALCCD